MDWEVFFVIVIVVAVTAGVTTCTMETRYEAQIEAMKKYECAPEYDQFIKHCAVSMGVSTCKRNAKAIYCKEVK